MKLYSTNTLLALSSLDFGWENITVKLYNLLARQFPIAGNLLF